MEAAAIKREENFKRLNPQLFSLWVGMASMLMLFAAFTSAYLVKQGAGNWLQFSMPTIFFISTFIIVGSSILLHLGFIAYKNRAFGRYKIFLLISTLLGLSFIICQYLGWQQLFKNGVDIKANVGGSFFYLITGAHAAHALGGITVLLISCLYAFSLPMTYNEARRNRIEMTLHFWHFLGALWVYLFVFLNVIR